MMKNRKKASLTLHRLQDSFLPTCVSSQGPVRTMRTRHEKALWASAALTDRSFEVDVPHHCLSAAHIPGGPTNTLWSPTTSPRLIGKPTPHHMVAEKMQRVDQSPAPHPQTPLAHSEQTGPATSE